MSKKLHKDKDGKVAAIELTDEDAEKLYKEMEEEAARHEVVPCECVTGVPPGHPGQPHIKQDNGKWKCQRCGNEKDELDVYLAKGESWFEREQGFENAIDKACGKVT